MAMFHGPDNVLRTEGRIATKEDIGPCGFKCFSFTTGMSHLSNSMPRSRSIHGKRVLLADGENHIVRREEDCIEVFECFAPASHSSRSNVMPFSTPFSMTKFFGA